MLDQPAIYLNIIHVPRSATCTLPVTCEIKTSEFEFN